MTQAQDNFYNKLVKYDICTRWAYSDFCEAKREYKYYKAKGWMKPHGEQWKKKALEAYYRFKMNRYDCMNEADLYNNYVALYSDLTMMNLRQFNERG